MRCGSTLLGCLMVASVQGGEPFVSGVPVGSRPGPYTFIVSTGKDRGQLTCYICETADKPGIVIFARSPHDDLGKLVAALDRVIADPKNAPLRAWVTFLSADQATMDSRVVDWGKKHAIKNIPLGVFEDPEGPPSYRLADEADVSIMLFVKQRVAANFAFRAGELSDTARQQVLAALPMILGNK